MASKAPPGDPRVMARLPEEANAMPVVRMPRAGLPGWAIAALALVAAVILFLMLDSRRREASAPAVRPRAADAQAVTAPPPPLFVPQGPAVPIAVAPVPAPTQAAPAPTPQIVYVPQPYPVPAPPQIVEQPAPQPRVGNEPALVFDVGAAIAVGGQQTGTAEATEATGPAATPGAPSALGARARAGVFANRSTTVAQGTLIPAVLETALDSTRPGLARAIVSHDVRGFDGSRVLIPRGSRLIGEYRSEVAPGQRRAMVNWTRLIRPDGATIAIGSPAGDPLGRGGVRARVNTHFFERFAGAILQSVLDIGVNLATGLANDGDTVVVVPGGGVLQQGAGQIIQPAQITPTLTVRQGTSISIFVARDLDFTTVEGRR